MADHDNTTKTGYNRLDINVKVDNVNISLNINRDEEQSLRAAATEVNRILSQYREKYSSPITSEKEILLYTALHFANQTQTAKIERQELNLKSRLDNLKEKLETALYPHNSTEFTDPEPNNR